ncbi:MAG: polyprenyl synthetase family protein [Burkholderiales bacterium]|nr:polyprenyl synthetase family protein [Burkholderiales bacterium]OJX02484.1 MAG: geranyl transferase [Burkholderiales bacterium 70-64]
MNASPIAAAPAGAAPASFEHWLAAHAQRAERALDGALPAAVTHPARLHDAMRYAVLGGGKRVRPLLAYAAGEAVGASGAALDRVGCAVELIHAYSLVHDDMPCMDDDVLRRGRPTVHVVYGEALAMLVGDALQALAFETLAGTVAHGVEATAALAMVGELARAAGSTGMAGGQAIDLAAVGAELDAGALEDMHRRKTGALLQAAVRLGGLCAPVATTRAGGGRQAALERYGEAIGLAFQVVDDILDVEGDSATLGKTAGKDAECNKPTYVSMLGMGAARALAARLREQAHAAIVPLGAQGRRLAELADLIVMRSA